MTNVFVEPRPKGRGADAPVMHYVLELAGDKAIGAVSYMTQGEAIAAAWKMGLNPLVARVRTTTKNNPDHWRAP